VALQIHIANIATTSTVDVIGLGAAVGDDAAPELLRAMMDAFKEDTLPEVEWWDEKILQDSQYAPGSDGAIAIKEDKIHSFIVRPVLIDPPAGVVASKPATVYLTKKVLPRLYLQYCLCAAYWGGLRLTMVYSAGHIGNASNPPTQSC
jgi:hypothetical protein